MVILNKIVKLYVGQIHVCILHTAWIGYPPQKASSDEPTHNESEAYTYRHCHAHVFTIHSGFTYPRAFFRWTVNKARVSSIVLIFCTWLLDKMYAKNSIICYNTGRLYIFRCTRANKALSTRRGKQRGIFLVGNIFLIYFDTKKMNGHGVATTCIKLKRIENFKKVKSKL